MAKRYSSSKIDPWRSSINRRIDDIKASIVQISKTLEALVQDLDNVETVYVEEDRDVDSTEENNADNDDDDDGDNDDSKTGIYFCPNVECRERKADTSLKQYVRHYDTHVECIVPCAICHSVSYHVAALKRHFYECRDLKRKRNVPEYAETLKEMETRRKEESKKASAEAREALKDQKRRHAPGIHCSGPRKKAKLEKRLEFSIPKLQEPPPSHTAGSSIPFLGVVNNDNTPDQQIGEPDSSALAGALCNINSTIGQPLAQPAAMEGTTHDVSILTGDVDFINPAISKLAMYPTTVGISEASSACDEAADGSAMHVNDQVSMAQRIATARRPLGFESHTMDGSGVFLDDQYPTAQNTVMSLNASSIYYPDRQYSAIRPSGFESHTMDGSGIFQANQFWHTT